MPIKHLRRHLLDRMVLRPSRGPLDHPNQERILLQCLGRPLECFVQRHGPLVDADRLLVIKFPGTSGRAEQSTGMPLSMLEGVGGTTWTWNPPGYGRSHGRASLPKIADAAIDFVRQVIDRQANQRTTIWLAGNSLGCATALRVAAELELELDQRRTGIVLRNPPPIVDVVKHIASRYPLGHLVKRVAESLHEPMNVLLTANHVHMPAVFLQSGADTLVPPEMQNKVIEAYRGPYQVVVMDNLSHDAVPNEDHERLIRQSLNWLLQQTGYEPTPS